MAAGFSFSVPTAEARLFTSAFEKLRERMATAFQIAAAELQFNIKSEGNANIRGAGNFSSRWTDAFTVRCEPNISQTSTKYTIDIFFNESIPYAHIHEFGGEIKPKNSLGSLFGPPLLWIPLSFANVPKSGGGSGKMTAQEYGASVSPLFRVNRQGKSPLLLSVKDRKPVYFGIKSVTIPQRFHIRDICAKNANDFGESFRKALGDVK